MEWFAVPKTCIHEYIYIYICVCVFENKYLYMHLVDRCWLNLNLVEVCRIYRWFRFCGFKSLGMRHDDRDDQKGECARIGPKVSQTNWFLTHLVGANSFSSLFFENFFCLWRIFIPRSRVTGH